MGLTRKFLRTLLCLPANSKKPTRASYNAGTIAHKFFEDSTVHGLGKIHGATTIFARMFWILVFTVIMSMGVYSVVGLFQRVLSYDMITSVESEFLYEGLQFPAVTFCNADPFVKDKMETIENLTNSTGGNHLKLDKNIKKKRNMAKLLAKLDLEDLYQSNESFFEPDLCHFGRKRCHMSDFRKRTIANQGNCYTFNYNGTLNQTGAGYNSGLFLVLNINQSGYDPEESFEMPAAVKMTLHHPSDEPDISKDSMLAAPGQYNHFRLTMQKLIRAKPPYKDNCTDDPPVPKTRCLMNCKIDAMLKTCGAVDTPIYLAMEEDGKKRLPPVEANESTIDCIDDFYHRFTSSSVACHCDVECKEITFDAAYSQGKWPTAAAVPLWIRSIKKDRNKTVTEKYIQNNYVAINVYYADFHIKTTRHIPAFEWDDFLSALGGQIGLYIGASIYSVLELASFVFELIAYHFVKVKQVQRITVAPTSTTEEEDGNN